MSIKYLMLPAAMLCFSLGAAAVPPDPWYSFLADLNDSYLARDAGQREAYLTARLTQLSEHSDFLVLETINLSREFEKLIANLPPAQRAQMLLQLEAVRSAAAKVAALTGNPPIRPSLEKGRILAIDSELKAVAVNLGSIHGIFNGTILRTLGDKPMELRVISVRPQVCAAVPVNGKLQNLTPGNEVSAVMTRENQQDK